MRPRSALLLMALATIVRASAAEAAPNGLPGVRGIDWAQVQKAAAARPTTADRDRRIEPQTKAKAAYPEKRDRDDRQRKARPRRSPERRADIIAGIQMGGLIVGSLGAVAALAMGGSAVQSNNALHSMIAYEQQTYVHLDGAAPGSKDAQFNDLASQVHRVSSQRPVDLFLPTSIKQQYHDTTALTVSGYHHLTEALLAGKLGNDPKYFTLAVNMGKDLTHDLSLREGNAGALHRSVDTDATLLNSRLNQLYGNPTVATLNEPGIAAASSGSSHAATSHAAAHR